jgi:hypothetical protein
MKRKSKLKTSMSYLVCGGCSFPSVNGRTAGFDYRNHAAADNLTAHRMSLDVDYRLTAGHMNLVDYSLIGHMKVLFHLG